MAGEPHAVSGIDPTTWQVRILPLPKRYSRGAAVGFCGGHPVGTVEALRSNSGAVGCWWPEGVPQLLTLSGRPVVAASRAGDDRIPGRWSNRTTGVMGAAAWTLENGKLASSEPHAPSCVNCWATAVGGGMLVGIGTPARTAGQVQRKVGLVWRDGAEPVVVSAAGDVMLFATDGERLAGSIHGRAALWTSPAAPATDLSPPGMEMSEVQGLDGELQIGAAFQGFRARAALWRGSAATFVDITPKGFQVGRAYAGTRGYQVGFVRRKDSTRDGGTGDDNRAALWQGAADRWFDLNDLLPAKSYNASSAWAIEVRGDTVRICGKATRYEVKNPGTPQECHMVPVAHPVLWTARLRG